MAHFWAVRFADTPLTAICFTTTGFCSSDSSQFSFGRPNCSPQISAAKSDTPSSSSQAKWCRTKTCTTSKQSWLHRC